jgi:hypothetical protein
VLLTDFRFAPLRDIVNKFRLQHPAPALHEPLPYSM